MIHRLLAVTTAAAMATAALPAIAQTADSTDAARQFSDPNFLPYEGQLYGITGYTYGSLHGDLLTDGGARQGSVHTTTNTIDQTFGYGVNDDFAIILSDSYVPGSQRAIDPVGAPSYDRDRSGLNDPTIKAIYRVLDERSNPVLLDLFASYSPDLIDAHSADPGHEGTVARGGQAGTFGVALGKEWDNFGIRASAGAEWLGDRESDNRATGGSTSENSSWNCNLDLTSQVRFNEAFSANLGTGYDIVQSVDQTREPSGDRFVNRPGNVGNLHAALNYDIFPGGTASLTYQYNDYANRSTDNVATTGLDSATRNRTENIVGARFQYALN